MTASGFAKLRSDAAQDAGSEPNYSAMVAELRSQFNAGVTKDISWRKKQLQQFKLMYEENHEEIATALLKDLGGAKMRAICEMGPHGAADELLTNLETWAKDETVYTPVPMAPLRMAKSYVRKEAKGVVLVISPWNFPLGLCFEPVACAIAAGNAVVIKPSEVSSNSAALIAKLVNKYLDTSCIKVVPGAVPETTALLKEHFDHIFYTGNGHIGRIVLRAAAEYLTPCTLELGGKSPAIIDKSASMQTAIERISAAKWLNAGQICVSPDYILVHEDRADEFIEGMKKKIEHAYGENPKDSPNFGRMINSNHVRRVNELLSKTQGTVLTGGTTAVDPDSHYFPPTLVKNAKLDEPLLKEEIFGPVLPILTVKNMDEAIEKVNAVCDRPLALYVYSEDTSITSKVLNKTLSGGVGVNTSFEQIINPYLPFGGVGSSGYGAYHGKAGFDEFCHRRAVFKQDTAITKGSFFPMKPGDGEYEMTLKILVTGFLTEQQRKMMKCSLTAGGALLAALVGAKFLRGR